MQIIFRVDASLHIGTGHVMRCLTLADALAENGANCIFICRMLEGNLINLISGRGYIVHALSKPGNYSLSLEDTAHASWLGVDWLSDAKETFKVIKSKSVDWLIVDHYSLDYRWEQWLRRISKRIMVLDDLADRMHNCDLILDQNYGSTIDRYRKLLPKKTVELYGPKYALINPIYSQAKRLLNPRTSEIKRVLIYYGGGVDEADMTGLSTKALNNKEFSHIQLDIVVGNMYAHKDKLQNTVKQRGRANIHTMLSDLSCLMKNADIAIGAGGSTTWERCAMGLPSLVVCIAKNQEFICNALAGDGIILYLANKKSLTVECLQESIRKLIMNSELMRSLSVLSSELVDGCGAKRVAKIIHSKHVNRQHC